ncbi:MAG: FAD-binding protein [Bacillaceae bacterium]|nr:FAD-binding protein [Bacillaceae bacterium]
MEEIVDLLKEVLDEQRVTQNPTQLEHHSRDESYHTPHLPDVVVFPRNKQEVRDILSLAYKYEVPVIPFGMGSSLEGHVIPYRGGISVDFSLMNQILEVLPDDFLVRVQPGVTRTQLNKELKKHGLFFSVDPGADATLGGMAATNASGTTSVRYGVMRDQVRDLEVVLADGRLIRTGTRAAKSSSGYHLTGLFVGSEGTLGLFTELTLRVYGIPEATMAARATFPSVKQAVEAVISILSAGIAIARIELIDAPSIQKMNEYKQLNYPVAPTLFLELHGNEQGLKQDVDFMRELVEAADCRDFQFEKENKARQELWEARHHLAYAFIHGSPGKKMMTTDVCVPISELAASVENARRWIDETHLEGAIVGHVGDGNFHTLLMIDPKNADDIKQAETINEKIVLDALQRGGTCTGEHGVGIGKMKYQQQEHGEAFLLMKQLKNTLDPKGILNPGKIFP